MDVIFAAANTPLGIVVCLVLMVLLYLAIPAKYDPAIRLKEWAEAPQRERERIAKIKAFTEPYDIARHLTAEEANALAGARGSGQGDDGIVREGTSDEVCWTLYEMDLTSRDCIAPRTPFWLTRKGSDVGAFLRREEKK